MFLDSNVVKALAAAASLALSSVSVQASMGLEEGQLTIWLAPDKPYRGMARLGELFEAETGIPVVVQHPDRIPTKFIRDAASGGGPDIVLWSHDKLGEWRQAGLITPVRPDTEIKQRLADFSWDAVNVNNEYLGYPLLVESVALIYNKALVPNPPSSWQAIPELDRQLQQQGKHAILWDYSNVFYSWGLMAAGGGYVFGETDGRIDVSDSGVAHPGAIDGLQTIVELLEHGNLPAGAGYSQMEERFAKGEVAMIINGPWSWSNYDHLDFGVAPLPKLNGSAAKPFVNVVSASINAASPNKDLATEFIEYYLLTFEGLAMLNQDKPLGAVTHVEFQADSAARDPRINATMQSAIDGTLVPSVMEMEKFWAIMGPTLRRVTNGSQNAREALNQAAARISQ